MEPKIIHLEQVREIQPKPVQTRRQLATDPEMLCSPKPTDELTIKFDRPKSLGTIDKPLGKMIIKAKVVIGRT
ncbi:hypothetical protein Tco_0199907 [Tanacetum coccineum]